MADDRLPDAGDAAAEDDARAPTTSPSGTPRWVLRFWLAALVLVLLVGLHVATGGMHRHGGP
ncbi:MAG TPA: hypothetical protein VGD56_07360 [Gemmatirosa sp.]